MILGLKRKRDTMRLWNLKFKKGAREMTRISIYDDTCQLLEKYADEHDTTIAEVIDELVEYLSEI